MKSRVLFVDDEPAVLNSFKRILHKEPFHQFYAQSGDEALRILEKEQVDIVVSDEKMPKMQGSKLLGIIEQKYPDTVRIILTGHASLDDAMQAINRGKISYYLTKPCQAEELKRVLYEAHTKSTKNKARESLTVRATHIAKWEWDVQTGKFFFNSMFEKIFAFSPSQDSGDFSLLFSNAPDNDRELLISAINDCLVHKQGFEIEHRARKKDSETRWVSQLIDIITSPQGEALKLIGVAQDITEKKRQEFELERNLKLQRQIIEETIKALSVMSEQRDAYTAGHQHKVAELAEALAIQLGLEEDKIQGLILAAKIHDIGKIGIPAEILAKPTIISKPEMEIIKMHPQMGYDILKNIPFPWPIADIVLQHHEKLDGSGYPRGLYAQDILLESRILTVADVFEAMSSHRPYRPAMGKKSALQELQKNAGLLFEQDVVDSLHFLIFKNVFNFNQWLA